MKSKVRTVSILFILWIGFQPLLLAEVSNSATEEPSPPPKSSTTDLKTALKLTKLLMTASSGNLGPNDISEALSLMDMEALSGADPETKKKWRRLLLWQPLRARQADLPPDPEAESILRCHFSTRCIK